MHRPVILTMVLLINSVGVLSAETAQSIIEKVDKNRIFTTQSFEATMIIQKGKRALTKTFYGYGQKQGEKSFMEFTNPEDKGVKYLKIENELWIYFPDADDVMKISGHMLRQGMMGSDLSYDDMLANDSLEENYDSSLKEDQILNQRNCYVIELNAKVEDVTYAKQVLYVDQEWYLPVKVEMYARGGRLIKEMTQTRVRRIGTRWVPMEGTIQDKRKKNSKTTFSFEKIEFDKPVQAKVFTKGYLQR